MVAKQPHNGTVSPFPFCFSFVQKSIKKNDEKNKKSEAHLVFLVASFCQARGYRAKTKSVDGRDSSETNMVERRINNTSPQHQFSSFISIGRETTERKVIHLSSATFRILGRVLLAHRAYSPYPAFFLVDLIDQKKKEKKEMPTLLFF